MKKTIVATVLCLLIGSTLYAQSTIKGQVKDTVGNSIPYLQIILKQNNIAVNGAYTDDLGCYQIFGIKKGIYDIYVGGTPICPKVHAEKDISISSSEVKFINFTMNCMDVEMHDRVIEYVPPFYELPKNGAYIYDVAFAEWQGRSMGATVIVEIQDTTIVVKCNENLSRAKGEIIDSGIIMWHEETKQWIIGHSLEDKYAKEVGGCSDGPIVIDFKRKKVWLC